MLSASRAALLTALGFSLLRCAPANTGRTPRCPTTTLPNCLTGPDRYSDEACDALDDFEARTPGVADPARSPLLTAPTEGQSIPSSTPFTFTWTNRLTSARPLRPAPAQLALARAPTVRDELSRWLTLVPEAQAHCSLFTGVGFALEFRKPDGTLVARAEQSATSFTPPAAVWSQLVAAGPALQLTIEATTFAANVPRAATPPAASTVLHFTLTP